MPIRSLRKCGKPGCDVLVRGAWCAEHGPKDQVVRDPRVKRMYNSRRWRSMRESQLASEPWCVDCMGRGEYVPACEVDHVTPQAIQAQKFHTPSAPSNAHR